MEFTRRYVVIAGLALALAGTAIVVERPFPLLGAVGLGAWLLAHQYRFVRRAGRTAESIAVDVRVDEPTVTVDRDLNVDVEVTADEPVPLAAAVRPTVPTAGRAASPVEPATVPVGETGAETSYAVRFPVAGTYRFDRPNLVLEDDHGFFATTLPAGGRPAVSVEPAGPRNVRIGRAGERAASVFGDDPGPRATRGIEPEEVRRYRPGDRAAQIDWRATARLNELHVREFSLEVRGRNAALIVDRRPRLAVGSPGETMLDYARAAGLAYLAGAIRSSTRLALYLVDDDAVHRAGEMADDAGGYFRLRRALSELSADGEAASAPAPGPATPAVPRTLVGRRLSEGGSAFERGLRPFFDVEAGRARRVESEPLAAAVRTWAAASGSSRETVIVTDDGDRVGLQEAVAEATVGGGEVTALLLPRVLFEADEAAGTEAAYDRYRSFEAFRRQLDRRPGVTAFEVGPGDRIDAILAAGAG